MEVGKQFLKMKFLPIDFPQFVWKSDFRHCLSTRNPAGQKIIKIIKIHFCSWPHISDSSCSCVLYCNGFDAITAFKNGSPNTVCVMSISLSLSSNANIVFLLQIWRFSILSSIRLFTNECTTITSIPKIQCRETIRPREETRSKFI